MKNTAGARAQGQDQPNAVRNGTTGTHMWPWGARCTWLPIHPIPAIQPWGAPITLKKTEWQGALKTEMHLRASSTSANWLQPLTLSPAGPRTPGSPWREQGQIKGGGKMVMQSKGQSTYSPVGRGVPEAPQCPEDKGKKSQIRARFSRMTTPTRPIITLTLSPEAPGGPGSPLGPRGPSCPGSPCGRDRLAEGTAPQPLRTLEPGPATRSFPDWQLHFAHKAQYLVSGSNSCIHLQGNDQLEHFKRKSEAGKGKWGQ